MADASDTSVRVRSRYRYMVDVVEALRDLGSEATAAEVYRWLEDRGKADPADLLLVQRDGGTRFRKEVRWARKELFDGGYLRNAAPGRWRLTPDRESERLTVEVAQSIVRENTRRRRLATRGANEDAPTASPWGNTPPDWDPASSPTTGPTPHDWSGSTSRSTCVVTWTYVLKFGSRDAWKIGHAGDLPGRLADINRHVPVEILGERWCLITAREWPDAVKAHAMEQAVLGALQKFRTVGERVACDEAVVKRAWETATF